MLPQILVIALIATIAAVIWLAATLHRKTHRRRIMAAPFPNEWQSILERNLPPYQKLPQTLRDQLHGYINIFLDVKNFEGCGGLEITEEMRLTIAAQACLLLIGRDSKCYPKLRSILVYPDTFTGGTDRYGGRSQTARLGESWQTGTVILAWNSVKGGAMNFDDGHNVTVHEFAHQLDQEDGAADGTPILESLSSYRSWATHLTDEYQSFLKATDKHRKTVIDKYGATAPAEFFATASEAFFEKPDQLVEKRPDLFEELKHYYHIDPRTWV